MRDCTLFVSISIVILTSISRHHNQVSQFVGGVCHVWGSCAAGPILEPSQTTSFGKRRYKTQEKMSITTCAALFGFYL